ncbi:MAG: methylated-DNA--[protein]-cysteine S-methyltransferase [Bacteroidia bacterium]|nr:methylated-DNA--[protein]-cysteine S-methyltransferase [Bacteroidia bacterium]
MIHSLSFDEKYQAILSKDPAFEGLFITAVKTTGIFCRPVCTARKPKPENVVFYHNPQEAILHGYRPCKVCKPMQLAEVTPDYVHQLLDELAHDPQLRIKDADLRERGIEPSLIRRWFNKHHSMTFHAYQRMLRINTAFQKISKGEAVTHTAFDTGYESLSGFNDSFSSVFGVSPTQSAGKQVIHIIRFATPLGPMYGCATEQGVCLAEFTNRRMLETEFHDLCRRLNAVILPGQNAHLDQLQSELAEYFEGKRQQFTLSLHTPGTPFQQQVWGGLQQIPYGITRSYKEQAMWLGRESAVRAVASANGMNRVAIVIPCHRVIGSDGSLTGYAGGLARKDWLLNFERNHAAGE